MQKKYNKLENLTKAEKSLLIYFETCATEYGGKVDMRKISNDEFNLAKTWDEDKFIEFGRIKFEDITIPHFSYFVFLSDDAWNLAHQERRARFNRINGRRTWNKTTE